MKVLFAIGNEQTSKRIAEKYYEQYGEQIEYKDVFYFKSLIDEVKANKAYDRIVVSEELESFIVKNVDSLDKFIFNKIDNITDEIENSEIIFICSDRRTKSEDKFVERLFNIGVYNVLIGDERNISSLCEFIRKPMNKKEAKRHLNIDPIVSNSALSGSDDTVEEIQIMNILRYYEGIKGKPNEYVPAFDRIAEQYSRNQLKIILFYLPKEVKEIILEQDKYRFLGDAPEERTITNVAKPNTNKVVSAKPSIRGLFGILKERDEGKKQEAQDNNLKAIEQAKRDRQDKEFAMQREQAKREEEIKKQAAEKKAEQEKIEKELAMLKAKEAEDRAKAQAELTAKKEAELKAQTTKTDEVIVDIMPKVEVLPKDNENKVPAEVETAKAQNDVQVDVQADAENKKEAFEKEQAELMARAKAEQEAKEQAELMAKAKAEQEAKEREAQKADAERARAEQTAALEAEKRKLEQERMALEQERRRLEEQEAMANEVAERNSRALANTAVNEGINKNEKIDYKKTVIFVGANKSGTTFTVNAVAHSLADNKIPVGILDMTRDKSLYYIYNQDDKTLRNIALECMQRLGEGEDSYMPIRKFLKVYTSMPGQNVDTRRGLRNKNIIDTVGRNNSIVIVDADFSTPLEYFTSADEIYIVQDLDIIRMQETTLFLRELKARGVPMTKIRIVINKYVKTMLTPKKLVEGLSYYNDPQMSFIDEILDSKVPYYLIPFSVDNYVKYIDGLYKNSLEYKKYSPDFLNAIGDLSSNVYKRSPQGKKGLFR